MIPAGRRSAVRWQQVACLLRNLERGVEALARLEAHTDNGLGRPAGIKSLVSMRALDHRLITLGARIDRELDRLTVERLRWDLAEKQRRRNAGN